MSVCVIMWVGMCGECVGVIAWVKLGVCVWQPSMISLCVDGCGCDCVVV